MSNENKYIKSKINYLLNFLKHTIYRYPNYYFMFYKKIESHFLKTTT